MTRSLAFPILLSFAILSDVASQAGLPLQEHNVKGSRVGIVLSTVLSNVPGLQVHYSTGVSDRLEVGLSAGYAYAWQGGEEVSGPMLTPIMRFFFYPQDGYYIGLAGDFRWTTKRKKDYVERYGAEYEEYFEFDEKNRYSSVLLLVGQYMDYGKIGFDVGIGFGSRTRYTRYEGLPSDVFAVNTPTNFFDPSSRNVQGESWTAMRFMLYFE